MNEKKETKKTAEDLKERKVPEEELKDVAGGFESIDIDVSNPVAKGYKGGLIKQRKK